MKPNQGKTSNKKTGKVLQEEETACARPGGEAEPGTAMKVDLRSEIGVREGARLVGCVTVRQRGRPYST